MQLNPHILRYPIRKNETLKAYDSADELLIEHISSLDLKSKRILIVNDQFGALSLALNEFGPLSYTDSYVSYKALLQNSNDEIHASHDLQNIQGVFDFIVLRLPKNLSYLEDILAHLTMHLHPDSQLICASMVKHLAPSSFDLIQKYIGNTTTSLAQKKARLIFAKFEKEKISSPYPKEIKIEGFEHPFTHHSNLFSREKLDIGTRFFLEHIPHGNFQKILDLGCANGIVGIKAKILNPEAQIIFTDESGMAIESARINYQKFFKDEASFVWMNCYEGQPPSSLDLVLCNPPFHQQSTIGDFIAWQMFQDAHQALKKSGTLRIIGNSHLGYQLKLKKIFGNAKIIATNQKFMIIEAHKTL